MPKGGARSGGSSRSSRSVNPSSLGFKSGGVVKGSAAAKMMSSQGSVKAGSDIAQLQSHGAKGTPYGLASKPSSRSGGSSGAAKSISPAALGFKPGGVEKGTVAAKMMSTLGSVKSGTIVAQMQSSGAKGTSEGVSCTTHRSSSGQAQYVKCTVKK